MDGTGPEGGAAGGLAVRQTTPVCNAAVKSSNEPVDRIVDSDDMRGGITLLSL